MKIRVASRESTLAVIQANMVIACLKSHVPNIETELITMKTTGDKILDKTLDKIGGKGLFVKELDLALLESRADITVHSMKDMPMDISDSLPVIAVSKREDPRDALILPKGKTEIDFSKPIGCSSKRRELQLKQLFPECVVKPIRGNVQTRLLKLDSGEYSATVLACAGLKRLGLESRISRIFETSEILPAACQGILAVQAKSDFDASLLSCFNDATAFTIAQAERAFVRKLDGGCSSPVAAFCEPFEQGLKLTGMYVDSQGNVHKRSVLCNDSNAEQTAEQLAIEMKAGISNDETR